MQKMTTITILINYRKKRTYSKNKRTNSKEGLKKKNKFTYITGRIFVHIKLCITVNLGINYII